MAGLRKPRKLKHRCTAHSKQTGKRCRQPAEPGCNVCRFHGGAAPQVRASAQQRIAALVDPALDRLAKLVKTKNERVALGAVKDVLDRNGLQLEDCLTFKQMGRLLSVLIAGVQAEARIAVEAARFDAFMRAVQTRVAQAIPELAERVVVEAEIVP